MEVLRVKSLYRSFGGIKATENVSFQVEKGEKVAILGPNGAGKSTLFNLIDGQLPVSGGQIYFCGREITSLPQHRRVSLGIGRSFQANTLFPTLTVVDNLLLAIQGIQSCRFHMFRSIANHHQKANQILEIMELEEKKNDPVRNLAYGEQRKLEIALTLASKPTLLLLDEPNCGLTAMENANLINIINKLGPDATVLLITHDMDLVFEVVNRIIVLHYGQVIADGSPEEIQANHKVKEIYMGVKEETAC
jgi:branched-chain amino acid transport system ATP-binding protein